MAEVVELLALLAVISSGGTQPKGQIIEVGGRKLDVPIPQGYCLPSGEAAEDAKAQAKLDDRNATLLFLVDCRREKAMENFLVIKTPLSMLTSDVSKDELLQELGGEGFNDPDFRRRLDAGEFEKHASERASEIAAKNVTIETTFKPRGLDQTCAYLGGNYTVTGIKDKAHTMAVAACITAVGNRGIGLYASRIVTSGQSFEGLYKPLRDWAHTIKPAAE